MAYLLCDYFDDSFIAAAEKPANTLINYSGRQLLVK